MILLCFFALPATQGAPTNHNRLELFCPTSDKLIKSPANLWDVPPHWKSYEISFAQKIGSFKGAQWTGTNIGQVICVYATKNQTDSPILLYLNSLTQKPNNSHWHATSSGVLNCRQSKTNIEKNTSFSTKQCPFYVLMAPKSKQSTFEQSIKLKKQQ